ncbi:N-acetyltransferase 6 isoform X1 [Lingula anatina]|uniref:N-acetyltransferase 6 isoform X1 n=1 Tax=Lingula anatina TaxID=7574 RepID=A0A1S3KCC0_LINAN|nr:N-acetyltransferase 6 isoform X1 [Lingula anatina]|eukprot:XP_013420084.1 N-acetyltransferase 6 isoform X1 [Lingula anatina]
MMSLFEVLPLHHNREYNEECANLLNSEWARSMQARLHSLEKSCDELPLSLVLIAKDSTGKTEVLGHSKISPVVGRKDACFIESVVVAKARRGQGLGRKIMEGTEEYAKNHGIKTTYLTTHDKQDFYEHLGYEFCEPICAFTGGSGLLSEDSPLFQALQKNTKDMSIKEQVKSKTKNCVEDRSHKEGKVQNTPQTLSTVSPAPPPPPPPPLPPPPPPPTSSSPSGQQKLDDSNISWMCKQLTSM